MPDQRMLGVVYRSSSRSIVITVAQGTGAGAMRTSMGSELDMPAALVAHARPARSPW